MSVLRNLYARSEQWRLEWGFRTCVSVALVSFLCLYPPTRERFARFGVTGFALVPVTTVFVKDLTLGQTLVNGWYTLFGAFAGSFLAWVIFRIYRDIYADYLPLWLLLITEFVIAFLLQYSEMVLVARKFAICVFAINLIANRQNPDPDFRIWGLFLSICLGTGCALAGCIIPLPVRLAGTELQERVVYYSEATAALVQDITESWVHTHRPRAISNTISPMNGAGIQVVQVGRAVKLAGAGQHADGEAPQCPTEENPHWRRLRLYLTAVAAFQRYSRQRRRCSDTEVGAQPSGRELSTRVLREELMSYLEESLLHLQSRNNEAKFGPSRRFALRCMKYVKLIQDVLLIITRLETHVGNMEKRHKYHFVYEAFFARPNFHYAVTLYGRSLSEMILSISRVLAVQTSLRGELLPSGPESCAAVQAAAHLVRARTYFDAEYLLARRDLFYPEHQSVSPSGAPSAHTERMRAFTELSDVDPYGGGADREEGRPRTGSLQGVGVRAYGKAMIDMHSTVFLMDTLSRLLLEFWPQKDLARLSKAEAALHQEDSPSLTVGPHRATDDAHLSEAGSENTTADDDSRHRSPLHENLRKFCVGFGRFLIEILPTKQAHLLPFTLTSDWRLQWAMTPALWQRFVSAATVAAAIALGAWYGIVAERPSPALPSFTIAFLAGGAVSGINVMTCINRAAGTAVACVYSVLVAYIVSNWRSEAARDCFLALAVVALQVPACYVRSYPLYSYSGTVTGFTVAMILLTSNATTAVAVNRIIDTYVAVAIYLLMEFLVSATYTEEQIFRDMRQVFEGIEDKFTNFNHNFHFFKAAEDAVEEVKTRIRGGTLTQIEVAVELHRVERLREDVRVRQDLEVDAIQAVIKRQRQLVPFYRSEPAVFRPAAFPMSLLQESIELQEQAANSIQIMIWAVKACDGTFSDQVERLVDKVNRKLQASVLRRHRLQLTPPAHTPPPRNPFFAPPGKVVEMTTVGQSGKPQLEGGPSAGQEPRPLPCLPPPPQLKTPTRRPVSSRSSTSSTSSLAGRVVPILPEFKTLLLPLEPHFVEVQRFVAVVLVYLSSAMDRITDWKPTLRAFYAPTTELPLLNNAFVAIGALLRKCKDSRQRRRDRQGGETTGSAEGQSEGERRRAQQEAIAGAVRRASGALGKLTALTHARHVAQLGAMRADLPQQVYEGLTHGKEDVFDTDTVHKLYLSYQALVEDLHRSLASDVLDHDKDPSTPPSESPEPPQPRPHPRPEPRRIPSNREVVIINTLLASTQQLIAALHGLTTLVSRLQAHRDIRVTQDGKRA